MTEHKPNNLSRLNIQDSFEPSSLMVPDSTPPGATTNARKGKDFRLNKVEVVERDMRDELRRRSATLKKYKSLRNGINGFETALTSVTLILGGTGLVLSTTGVGLVLAVPALVGFSISGTMTAVSKIVNNRIRAKVKKHEKIKILTALKINSIIVLTSNALNDGYISEDEFKIILFEYDKFRRLKEKIRAKASVESALLAEEGAIEGIQKGNQQLDEIKRILKNEVSEVPEK